MRTIDLMVAYIQTRAGRAGTLAFTCVAIAGTLAAYAIAALGGTKTGAALALTLTAGPAIVYAALVAPLAFPFGLYVFVTPLDHATAISSFGTLTRILGIASGAALLFYMIRTKRLADPDRSVAMWTLFMLWSGASLFWAQDVNMSMAVLPTALQLFALYAVVSMMRIDFRRLRALAGTAVAGGAISAAYILYLYHNGMANFKERLWLRTDTMNVDPDHFAAALLLPIILALMTALWTRSRLTRLAAIVSLGIMLPTLFLTGSRGSELAFVVMVIFIFFKDAKHRWALAGTGGALFALGVASAGASFAARWSDALAGGGAGRTDIWRVGWLAFKQNWMFGAGYENFPLAYDRAFINVFQPLYANWDRVSHNILLGTAVDLGIVGVILLLAAWVAQYKVLGSISPDDPRFPLRIGLEASIIGLFVVGMFVDLMVEKYTWLAFMLAVLTRNAVVRARAADPQTRTTLPSVQEMPANA